jgi:hypothetical protein
MSKLPKLEISPTFVLHHNAVVSKVWGTSPWGDSWLERGTGYSAKVMHYSKIGLIILLKMS